MATFQLSLLANSAVDFLQLKKGCSAFSSPGRLHTAPSWHGAQMQSCGSKCSIKAKFKVRQYYLQAHCRRNGEQSCSSLLLSNVIENLG